MSPLYLMHMKGQGLVEYALIVVLVAIVIIGGLSVFGESIGDTFSSINSSQSGLHVSGIPIIINPTVAPTQTPTVTPTKTPTVIPTETPTDSPTETPISVPTWTPTVGPTPTDQPWWCVYFPRLCGQN